MNDYCNRCYWPIRDGRLGGMKRLLDQSSRAMIDVPLCSVCWLCRRLQREDEDMATVARMTNMMLDTMTGLDPAKGHAE